MRKFIPLLTILFFLSTMYGCDKEKIITTTETISEVEYVELPPDTVLIADTLYLSDSIVINNTDTLYINTTDTLNINNTDTLVINTTDTFTVYDTTQITHYSVDTVEIVHNFYDTVTVTVTVTDTVTQNNPDAYYAYSALQYHTNPGVLQFINAEFGLTDGWIFYLTSFQNEITNPSPGVYDYYGYIDYWTPDWSSYYPLEYYWRVTFTGGDPSNPQNWQLTDPPDAVNGNSGGFNLVPDRVLK